MYFGAACLGGPRVFWERSQWTSEWGVPFAVSRHKLNCPKFNVMQNLTRQIHELKGKVAPGCTRLAWDLIGCLEHLRKNMFVRKNLINKGSLERCVCTQETGWRTVINHYVAILKQWCLWRQLSTLRVVFLLFNSANTILMKIVFPLWVWLSRSF